MMAGARRSAREFGKSDPIDALAGARAALREPELPKAQLEGPSRHLRILVERREDVPRSRSPLAIEIESVSAASGTASSTPPCTESRSPRSGLGGGGRSTSRGKSGVVTPRPKLSACSAGGSLMRSTVVFARTTAYQPLGLRLPPLDIGASPPAPLGGGEDSANGPGPAAPESFAPAPPCTTRRSLSPSPSR